MLNGLARAILFFCSYIPLAVIFVILYSFKSAAVVVVASAVIVAGLSGLGWILLRARVDVHAAQGTVIDYRGRGDEVMGYVAGYLIPFVGFSLMDLRQTLALLVFLFMLAFLYVTTDLIHINPTLYLLGFRVYEVRFERATAEPGSSVGTAEPPLIRRVITRGTLRRGDILGLVPLTNDLFIEKERK